MKFVWPYIGSLTLLFCFANGSAGAVSTSSESLFPHTSLTTTSGVDAIPQASSSPINASSFSEHVRNFLSVVNLILVWWIYRQTCKDRKDERDENRAVREKQLERELNNFWVQKLILEPSNEFIHKFFNAYEIAVIETPKAIQQKGKNKAELTKHASTAIRAFKTEYHQLSRRVILPLCDFDPAFKPLLTIGSAIEDLVTREFSAIPGLQIDPPSPNSLTADAEIRELRQQFFD